MKLTLINIASLTLITAHCLLTISCSNGSRITDKENAMDASNRSKISKSFSEESTNNSIAGLGSFEGAFGRRLGSSSDGSLLGDPFEPDLKFPPFVRYRASTRQSKINTLTADTGYNKEDKLNQYNSYKKILISKYGSKYIVKNDLWMSDETITFEKGLRTICLSLEKISDTGKTSLILKFRDESNAFSL